MKPEEKELKVFEGMKWDDETIDSIGEVVGFIKGSNYIMVKLHDEDSVKLDDDVYSSAPKRRWVGLTNKEFQEVVNGLEDLEDIWIAIEAKLKEKNT